MIKSVAVALLYFNKAMPQFEQSLRQNLSALVQSGLIEGYRLPTTDGLAVDMARNLVVEQVLLAGDDAIIWLDTDMMYPVEALATLVSHANKGYPIVAGLYRRTRKPFELLTEIEWHKFATIEELEAAAAVAKDGLPKVAMTAGGFSIVNTRLYREIPRPWYCNWDWDRDGYEGKGPVGEDRFFILRAREAGYDPVVDVNLHAIHMGRSYITVNALRAPEEAMNGDT